jgi:hypothetical protein
MKALQFLLAALAAALLLTANMGATRATSEQRTLESFAVGMKMTRHRIQIGADTSVVYRAGDVSRDGQQTTSSATLLSSGQAKPLARTW